MLTLRSPPPPPPPLHCRENCTETETMMRQQKKKRFAARDFVIHKLSSFEESKGWRVTLPVYAPQASSSETRPGTRSGVRWVWRGPVLPGRWPRPNTVWMGMPESWPVIFLRILKESHRHSDNVLPGSSFIQTATSFQCGKQKHTFSDGSPPERRQNPHSCLLYVPKQIGCFKP